MTVRFLTLVAAAIACLAQAPERSPMVQFWNDVRRELIGPNGAQYFESNVKNTAFPRMLGTVVSINDSKSETVLIVKLSGRMEAELKLILRSPVKKFFREGDLVQFEGAPQSFTSTRFLVTIDVTYIGVPVPK